MNLQASGVPLDEASEFGETSDASFLAGNVGDVGVTHERYEVVFAQRGERDVADHDHFIVTGLKRGAQVRAGVGLDAFEELDVHIGHPARSLQESVAIDVFANRDQQLADGRLDAITINHEPSPL